MNVLETDIFEHWLDLGNVTSVLEAGVYVLRKETDMRPGAEQGLVSKNAHDNVSLSFEVNFQADTCFIAKILQADQLDQKTNSYHLMCCPGDYYFARHNHIFGRFHINQYTWEKLNLVHDDGQISIYLNDNLLLRVVENKLNRGYAFLGIKGGEVHLRNINLQAKTKPRALSVHNNIEYEMLYDFKTPFAPVVSIVTTVYDRVECLRNCLRSVQRSTFNNYEHIIVSDAPPREIIAGIREIVENEDNGKICYANLRQRYNNWGIAPAAVGLGLARGEYIGFLSDDNGYTPDHVTTLVEVLEKDPGLGFAYSSCLYAGQGVLNAPIPRPGRIDLGQPLFRRELFQKYLQNSLPFNILAWDWQMIDFFMRKGVRWKHIDKPSFLFRLAQYPQFLSA